MNTSKFLRAVLLICVVSYLLILLKPAKAKLIIEHTFESNSFDGITRQHQEHRCSSSQSYIDNSLFKIVSHPVRAGKYALRHQIKNCDERSEVVIPEKFFKKDQEYWIGWSYLFPQDFNNSSNYTIVQQMSYLGAFRDQHNGQTLFECHRQVNKLKDGTPGVRTVGAPGSDMTIAAEGDQFVYKLKYYKGINAEGKTIFGCKSFTIPNELERWQDFVMHVKFSGEPDTGYIQLWKNGELYLDEKMALMPPWKDSMGAWKIGAYVGNPGKGERLLYIDELKVGDATSGYADVAPEGFGTE